MYTVPRRLVTTGDEIESQITINGNSVAISDINSVLCESDVDLCVKKAEIMPIISSRMLNNNDDVNNNNNNNYNNNNSNNNKINNSNMNNHRTGSVLAPNTGFLMQNSNEIAAYLAEIQSQSQSLFTNDEIARFFALYVKNLNNSNGINNTINYNSISNSNSNSNGNNQLLWTEILAPKNVAEFWAPR